MSNLTSEQILDSLVLDLIAQSEDRNHVVYKQDFKRAIVAEMPMDAKSSLGVINLTCQALPVMARTIEDGNVWAQVSRQVCQTMVESRTHESILLREFFKRRLAAGKAEISSRKATEWDLSQDNWEIRLGEAFDRLSTMKVLQPRIIDDRKDVIYELAIPVANVFGDEFAGLAFGLNGMADPELESIKPAILRNMHSDWFLDR